MHICLVRLTPCIFLICTHACPYSRWHSLPLSFCKIVFEDIFLTVLPDEMLNQRLMGIWWEKRTYFAVLSFYHHASQLHWCFSLY